MQCLYFPYFSLLLKYNPTSFAFLSEIHSNLVSIQDFLYSVFCQYVSSHRTYSSKVPWYKVQHHRSNHPPLAREKNYSKAAHSCQGEWYLGVLSFIASTQAIQLHFSSSGSLNESEQHMFVFLHEVKREESALEEAVS